MKSACLVPMRRCLHAAGADGGAPARSRSSSSRSNTDSKRVELRPRRGAPVTRRLIRRVKAARPSAG